MSYGTEKCQTNDIEQCEINLLSLALTNYYFFYDGPYSSIFALKKLRLNITLYIQGRCTGVKKGFRNKLNVIMLNSQSLYSVSKTNRYPFRALATPTQLTNLISSFISQDWILIISVNTTIMRH
jgi:hypothetical protein